MKQIGVFMTIPFVLALPPMVGWFFGHWLDEKLQTDPYFMFGFILLGFVAGAREAYRLIKRYGNDL